MTKITLEMTELAYEMAKEVDAGRLSRNQALDRLEDEVGMNRGSASDYLVIFRKMMKGEEYKRTCNNTATDFVLQEISSDFGTERYRAAIRSVEKHILYYNSLKHGNLNSIQAVLEKHIKSLGGTKNE